MTLHYRQPIAIGWSMPALALIAATGPLGGQYSLSELMGASIVAGAALLALGLLGVGERLMGLLPLPIVLGMFAGSTLHLVTDVCGGLESQLLVVGAALAGLAILRTVMGAVEKMATGEPRLSAFIAFSIAASPLTIAGIGPIFWATAGGLLVATTVERAATPEPTPRVPRVAVVSAEATSDRPRSASASRNWRIAFGPMPCSRSSAASPTPTICSNRSYPAPASARRAGAASVGRSLSMSDSSAIVRPFVNPGAG